MSTVPSCMHPACTLQDFQVLASMPNLFKVLNGMREISKRELIFSKPFDCGKTVTVYLSVRDGIPIYRVMQEGGTITVFDRLSASWFAQSANPATILKKFSEIRGGAVKPRLLKNQTAVTNPLSQISEWGEKSNQERTLSGLYDAQCIISKVIQPPIPTAEDAWNAICALVGQAPVDITGMQRLYEEKDAHYQQICSAIESWTAVPRLNVVQSYFAAGSPGAYLQWGRMTANLPPLHRLVELSSREPHHRVLSWIPDGPAYAAKTFADIKPQDAEHIHASVAMLKLSMGDAANLLNESFAPAATFHLPTFYPRSAPHLMGDDPRLGSSVDAWSLSGMLTVTTGMQRMVWM